MKKHNTLINLALKIYPDTQAIYLFGSYNTEDEKPDSDIDIALLLPVETSTKVKHKEWLALSMSLAKAAGKEKADLVNLQKASAVFRKEIIMADHRIYCADENAADEFEMLVISLYQQLQYERKSIIEEAIKSGSILHA
jgi:predicted nucleotidyltransferase